MFSLLADTIMFVYELLEMELFCHVVYERETIFSVFVLLTRRETIINKYN